MSSPSAWRPTHRLGGGLRIVHLGDNQVPSSENVERLGKVDIPLSEILSFGPGSIIEVGHLIDEPVELLVNDKLIARGDVVVVDEKFGLRITEIISPQERIESLS